MTARIQVKETKRVYWELEGSLVDIISKFQSALDEGWEGIELECDQWSQEHEVPYLYKHREETDKEYEIRMKEFEKEERKKLKEKEKRRIQYEKLKKEFGDT